MNPCIKPQPGVRELTENEASHPLRQSSPDGGLLLLRLAGAFLLLYVHGLPKLLQYSSQVQNIEDPFHMGKGITLSLAIFAEVLCPLMVAVGYFARLACLPILFLLLVAMLCVHSDWGIAQGQVGWLLFTIFASIFVAGPGKYSFQWSLKQSH
jgi:putative oxidoreductase